MLFKLPLLSLLSVASALPLEEFSKALNNVDTRGKSASRAERAMEHR